jgi:hypothetical protein
VNHTRLMCLLQIEQAPQWFLDAGGPQSLWELTRTGHDPGDDDLVVDLGQREWICPDDAHRNRRIFIDGKFECYFCWTAQSER